MGAACSGGSAYVCIPVPRDLADELYQWGLRNIPDRDLLDVPVLHSDVRVLPADMHVTLFLALPRRPGLRARLRRFCAEQKEFEVCLAGVTTFAATPENPRDVVKVDLSNAAGFARLRAALGQQLGAPPDAFSYNPHITIAFRREACPPLPAADFRHHCFRVAKVNVR